MGDTSSHDSDFQKKVLGWIEEEVGPKDQEPAGAEDEPGEVFLPVESGERPPKDDAEPAGDDLKDMMQSAARELAAAREIAEELGNRGAIDDLRRPGNPKKGVEPGKLRVLAERIAGTERAADILGQLETLLSSGEMPPDEIVERLRGRLESGGQTDEDGRTAAESLRKVMDQMKMSEKSGSETTEIDRQRLKYNKTRLLGTLLSRLSRSDTSLTGKILAAGVEEKNRSKDARGETYDVGSQVIVRQALEDPELGRMFDEIFERLPKSDAEKAIAELEAALATGEINEGIKRIAGQVKAEQARPKERFGAAREEAMKAYPDIQPTEVKSRGRKPVTPGKPTLGSRMKRWFKSKILGIK